MQSSTGRCTIFPVKISVDDGPYITLTMKATPMNFLLSNHPVTWSLDDVMCWYLLYCSESNTLVTKEASGQIDFSQDSQRHCQLLIAIHSSNWVATQSTLGDLVSSFHCCISNCMQSLLSVFLVIAQVCIYNLLSWVTSINLKRHGRVWMFERRELTVRNSDAVSIHKGSTFKRDTYAVCAS